METTNTYSATTLSLTAHDYIALCQAEIDRQEAHWTTNTAKACNKMRFLIQLLQSVSPEAVFRSRAVAGIAREAGPCRTRAVLWSVSSNGICANTRKKSKKPGRALTMCRAVSPMR